MGIKQAIDIDSKQKKELLTLFNTYLPNTKIWAYGSRVKWSEKPSSDLDLVAFSKSAQASAVSKLKDALVESDLPFKVDLLIWDNIPNSFQVNIKENYFELQSDKQEGLPSGWRVVEFSNVDILTIEDGDRGSNYPKRNEFNDNGFCLFLNTGNVRKNGFQFTANSFISKEKDNILRNGKLVKNDVVLTTRGTIGNVGFYDSSIIFKNLRINSGMVILRSNVINLYPLYLYQFVKSILFHLQIKALSSGSAQPQLPIRDLKKVKINLPPLPEQKAIAHILGKLDDKIELNRQINQTLETMAQMLFKSWFVNFDPVIDNAIKSGNPIPDPLKPQAQKRKTTKSTLPKTTQDLFPNRFVFNENLKKWIPEGWAVKNFGKLLEKTIGGDWGKDKPDNKHTERVRIIRGTDIANIKQSSIKSVPVRYVESKKLKTRKLLKGDIIIEISGGTKNQPTGRSLYLTAETIASLDGIVEPASFCRLFRPINQEIGLLLREHLLYIYDKGKTWNYQNQSTGISNFQTTIFLEKELIATPTTDILKKYFDMIIPIIKKMMPSENITLQKIRDTLLPKLISGKIRVKNKVMENKVKKAIASANINFLIGSGISMPFLETLTGIEEKLSKAENSGDTKEEEKIKKEYFEGSISRNSALIGSRPKDCQSVLEQYKQFYKTINALILQRESSLLSKQVNIFTTNIDIFSEVALDETGIEFNDGFHGRFNPKYNIGNFKKSYYKTSLHYENTSEIPVFNIIKLHGSVSWCKEDKNIGLDKDLKLVSEIEKSLNNGKFKENYDKLMIVNPSKKKFEDTVLNETHYDLLRIYNNELEKENSVLFVMGFSFADEHIKELTLRVANTNPTSIIYIFVYDKNSDIYAELKNNAKNSNIYLLDDKIYNFQEINSFFSDQLNKEDKKPQSDTEANQQKNDE